MFMNIPPKKDCDGSYMNIPSKQHCNASYMNIPPISSTGMQVLVLFLHERDETRASLQPWSIF